MRRIDNLLLLFKRFLKEMEMREYYTYNKKLKTIHGHMPYYWCSLFMYGGHHTEAYLTKIMAMWSFLWQYYVFYTLNFIDKVNKVISYEFDDTVKINIDDKKELEYHNILANLVDFLVPTDENDSETKIWLCREKRISDDASDIYPTRHNLFGELSQFLYKFIDDDDE